jgi:FkbM family methyltransferase
MTTSSSETSGRLENSSVVNLSLCGLLCYPKNDAVLQYLREGWFEYQELVFTSRILRSGDVFIDIGAHCGLYSAIAASCLGPEATIVSVEPNPDLYAYLRKNIVYNRDAINEPIGAHERTLVKAAIYSGHDVLMLKRPAPGRSAYASISADFDPDEPINDEIAVPTRTLASLLPESANDALTLIKLDTEGAELAILDQSLPLLPAERPIMLMIEFDEGNLQRSSASSQALAKVIEDHGFSLYQFEASDNTIHPFNGPYPIWGQNLIATRHPNFIADRLRTLNGDVLARTQEYLERGRAAERLYQRSELFDRLVGAIDNLGERAHTEWLMTQNEPIGSRFAEPAVSEFFAATANGVISNANDQFGKLASSVAFIRSDIASKNAVVAELTDKTEAQERRIRTLVDHAHIFAHRLNQEIAAIEQGVRPQDIDVPAPDVETPEAVDRMMSNLHDQIGKLSSILEWFRGAVSTVAQLEDTIGAQDRRIAALVDHARVLSQRLHLEISAIEQGVSPQSLDSVSPSVETTQAVDQMMLGLHDQVGKLASILEWLRNAMSERNQNIEELSNERIKLVGEIEKLQNADKIKADYLAEHLQKLNALGLIDTALLGTEKPMQNDSVWDALFSNFSSIIERTTILIRDAESSRAMMSHLESELRTSVNAIEALSGQVATMRADIGLAREDLAVVIRALSEIKRAGTQVPGLGAAPVDTAIELAQRVKTKLAHAAQLTEAVRQQSSGSSSGSAVAADGASTAELQNTVRRLTGELRHVNSLATELASSSWMKLGGRVGARASTVLKSIVAVSHASLSVKLAPPLDGSTSDQTNG